MMWYWGGGVQWWGWLLGALGMVAFWGVVIWAVWYLATGMARRPTYEPPTRHETDPAKAILDERLARGEIDPGEYRRLLAVLRDGRAAGSDEQPPVGTTTRSG